MSVHPALIKSSIGEINAWLRRGFELVQQKFAHSNTNGTEAANTAVTVVLGNTGGDMDSCVSAIYLGLLLQMTSSCKEMVQVVPVMNFPKEDLVLRGDIVLLMRQIGVDTDALVHYPTHVNLDPVENSKFASVLSDPTFKVALVDHNKLDRTQEHLADRVTAIIDHHVDEGLFPEAQPRVITVPCGSAATLVAEYWRLQGSALPPVPAPALLRAATVMDTGNFTDEVKTTPKDIEEAAVLEALAIAADPTVTRDTLHADHKARKDAKHEVSNLNVQEQLRRDYKSFAWTIGSTGGNAKNISVGVAAWVESKEVAVARYGSDDLMNECVAFAESRQLDCLIIMWTFSEKLPKKEGQEKKEKVKRRQISFFNRGRGDAQFVVNLADGFCGGSWEGVTSDNDDKSMINCGFADRSIIEGKEQLKDVIMVSYEQGNATVSRKALTPLLATYITKHMK